MKERLSRFPVCPAGCSGGLVPDPFALEVIVILFAVVGGVISGLSQAGRKHFNSFGHGHPL
jgi:hypothetical protein